MFIVYISLIPTDSLKTVETVKTSFCHKTKLNVITISRNWTVLSVLKRNKKNATGIRSWSVSVTGRESNFYLFNRILNHFEWVGFKFSWILLRQFFAGQCQSVSARPVSAPQSLQPHIRPETRFAIILTGDWELANQDSGENFRKHNQCQLISSLQYHPCPSWETVGWDRSFLFDHCTFSASRCAIVKCISWKLKQVQNKLIPPWDQQPAQALSLSYCTPDLSSPVITCYLPPRPPSLIPAIQTPDTEIPSAIMRPVNCKLPASPEQSMGK